MIQIFYSYCHDEEARLTELRKEMALVIENAQASEWFDRQISGGENLSVIFHELEKSDIVLLLLSPGYLASPSCKKEIAAALKRRMNEGISVIPVVVNRCGWKEHKELRNILAVPTDGKPIAEWSIPGKAWEIIRAELKRAITKIQDSQLNKFSAKLEFRKKIGKIFFVQNGNRDIDLDEIFVFPNLAISTADDRKFIMSLSKVVERREPTVVRGVNQSGKTTLLRKIWIHSWEANEGALIIEGEDVRKRKPNLVIRDAFAQ